MSLGDIIRVEDAHTFVAKIPPDSKKETIGKFVKIGTEQGIIVGVIKNITNSIREDLIPYIHPDLQLKYAPFNEDFRNSYYFIYGLGEIRNGIVRYDVREIPNVGDRVELLQPNELEAFHTVGGKPSIAYFHQNIRILPQNILLAMLEQVESQHPECRTMLNIIRKYIKKIT